VVPRCCCAVPPVPLVRGREAPAPRLVAELPIRTHPPSPRRRGEGRGEGRAAHDVCGSFDFKDRATAANRAHLDVSRTAPLSPALSPEYRGRGRTMIVVHAQLPHGSAERSGTPRSAARAVSPGASPQDVGAGRRWRSAPPGWARTSANVNPCRPLHPFRQFRGNLFRPCRLRPSQRLRGVASSSGLNRSVTLSGQFQRLRGARPCVPL